MRIIVLLVTVAMAKETSSERNIEQGWRLFEGTEAMEAPLYRDTNPTHWVISPFGIERRLEAATNPVLETREPVNVALGFRMFRHLVSLEYSRFGETSGNETYHVDREFQDLLGWYRYAFYKNHSLRAVAGGGLGVYQEQVTSYFYDLKQDFNSGNKWTAAAGLGIEFEPVKYLVLLVEARLISGQNLDPNPNPDGLVRLSVQF